MTKTSFDPRSATVVFAAVIGLTACESMSDRQRHTATGAGVGAATGAVVGGATAGTKGAATGAVVGGAIGAVAGNLWSRRMEEKRAEMQRATQGTGIEVARTPDNQLKSTCRATFRSTPAAPTSSRRCARRSTSSRRASTRRCASRSSATLTTSVATS